MTDIDGAPSADLADPVDLADSVDLVDSADSFDLVDSADPFHGDAVPEPDEAPAPSVLKVDARLADAADQAREALVEVAEPGSVGDHLGMTMVAERLATHYFACLSTGYHGWRWAVTVARAPRQKYATVCESTLLPSDEALLAPQWLPYADRLAPGDLGAGDTLPYVAEDPHLMAGYEATDDDESDQLAFFELGLGRTRVLSLEGRSAAAQRWYAGSHGPTAEVAQAATGHCDTCGYFVPFAGALRSIFGVCANEWSPSDGGVVSLDHGCGAHSESDVVSAPPAAARVPLVDEFAVDTL